MKVEDIDKLFRDKNQDDLYNMFVVTFKLDLASSFAEYTVPDENEMRIDLVCRDIYNRIDDFDILLNINDIDNPLNIKSGSYLMFPPVSAFPNFRVNTQEPIETRATLLNANKLSRKDQSRQKYNETNQALPPNLQVEPQPQVRIEGNRVIIG